MKLFAVVIVGLLSSVYADRLDGIPTPQRRFSNGLPSTHDDPIDQYVKVEAEIIKLTNDGGLTENNAYCDIFNACDPIVYAHLDTQRPNTEWPGPVTMEYWLEVFRVKNVNSPLINKTIKRDSCARPYKDALLRVYAEDYSSVFSNDLINQWECPITRQPAESEIEAQWSPTTECTPGFRPGRFDSMALTYRYRAYYIDRNQCNDSLAASVAATPHRAVNVRSSNAHSTSTGNCPYPYTSYTCPSYKRRNL